MGKFFSVIADETNSIMFLQSLHWSNCQNTEFVFCSKNSIQAMKVSGEILCFHRDFHYGMLIQDQNPEAISVCVARTSHPGYLTSLISCYYHVICFARNWQISKLVTAICDISIQICFSRVFLDSHDVFTRQ